MLRISSCQSDTRLIGQSEQGPRNLVSKQYPASQQRDIRAYRQILDPTGDKIAAKFEASGTNAPLVQWYPGHVSRAVRQLQQHAKLVDMVLEVRDARCIAATTHPDLRSWFRHQPIVTLINYRDMVDDADVAKWDRFFAASGTPVHWTVASAGRGLRRVRQKALQLTDKVNHHRRRKGLLDRPVRALVVGFPNVGKSCVINQLLRRSICRTGDVAGVTRHLQWARIDKQLELLDSPGVLPTKLGNERQAVKLAACNDVAQGGYQPAVVASRLLGELQEQPKVYERLLTQYYQLYGFNGLGLKPDEFVNEFAVFRYNGSPVQAGTIILRDFRRGEFGNVMLDEPPAVGLDLASVAQDALGRRDVEVAELWKRHQEDFDLIKSLEKKIASGEEAANDEVDESQARSYMKDIIQGVYKPRSSSKSTYLTE